MKPVQFVLARRVRACARQSLLLMIVMRIAALLSLVAAEWLRRPIAILALCCSLQKNATAIRRVSPVSLVGYFFNNAIVGAKLGHRWNGGRKAHTIH